jgi:hypothetical protein
VYRDVGSEPHDPDDPEFVDIEEIAFEPDAALLLCSDGLTDLVTAATIGRIVRAHAGAPEVVVRELLAAANEAGGKDNVTAVYVEGPHFARATAPRPSPRRAATAVVAASAVVAISAAVISALASFTLLRPDLLLPLLEVATQALPMDARDRVEVVRPSQSIAAAIGRARPGTQVVVEPGEYHEQLRLRSGIRVVSRVPRGATIRLPVSATEVDPAVVASGVVDAELSGFRIVGDAATPLGVGVFATDATVSIQDVEILGATRAAVDLSSGAKASLVGSEIHDNPGAGLSIRSGAAPRVAHSAFARNGSAGPPAVSSVAIEAGAEPVFYRNVFQGMTPDVFDQSGTSVGDVAHDNWFLASPRPAVAPAGPGMRRRP